MSFYKMFLFIKAFQQQLLYVKSNLILPGDKLFFFLSPGKKVRVHRYYKNNLIIKYQDMTFYLFRAA